MLHWVDITLAHVQNKYKHLNTEKKVGLSSAAIAIDT